MDSAWGHCGTGTAGLLGRPLMSCWTPRKGYHPSMKLRNLKWWLSILQTQPRKFPTLWNNCGERGEEHQTLLPRGKYSGGLVHTPVRVCAHVYVDTHVNTHTEQDNALASNVTWRITEDAIGCGNPAGMRYSSCWYPTACLKMKRLAVEMRHSWKTWTSQSK